MEFEKVICQSCGMPMKKQEDNLLREVVGDHVHDLKRQTMLHEGIRNDEDYDDWEYGTEPIPLTEF